MSSVADRTFASPHWKTTGSPRLILGDFRTTETAAWLLSRVAGALSGGRRVRVLDAMGLSRGLLWGYLPLALAVVPFTSLSRIDCELVTLRTAWDIGARYEWHHHVYAARWTGGFSPETVERVTQGPDAEGWTDKQRLLLRAVDELHSEARTIGDATWADLTQYLTPRQLVDLTMLVGHYDMLGLMLKSLGVEPEDEAWLRGPFSWLRRDDDSDRLGPNWMRPVHKWAIRQFATPLATVIPPLAVLHNVGRTTAKAYRTPVFASLRDGVITVPLVYGDKTDWVRNILAAGSAEITCRRRTHKITNPRIIDGTQTEGLPTPAKVMSRLMKVLVMDITT